MSRKSIVPFSFGGLFNSFGKSRVPFGRCYRMENATVERGILEARPGFRQLYRRSGHSTSDVAYGYGYGKYGTSEKYLAFIMRNGQTKADVIALTPGNTATTVSSATASGAAVEAVATAHLPVLST